MELQVVVYNTTHDKCDYLQLLGGEKERTMKIKFVWKVYRYNEIVSLR